VSSRGAESGLSPSRDTVTDSLSMAAIDVMPGWFSCTRVFTKSNGKVDIHPTEITAIASVSECSL